MLTTPKQLTGLGIPLDKTWIIGTKNFGYNTGFFYKKKKRGDYFNQRTVLVDGYLERNEKMKTIWGDRYLDIIGSIVDDKGTVPVFTDRQKFISQDTWHFTKGGAIFFSQIFEEKIKVLLLTDQQ